MSVIDNSPCVARVEATAILADLNLSRGRVRDILTGSHNVGVWEDTKGQRATISEYLREIQGSVALIAATLGLDEL